MRTKDRKEKYGDRKLSIEAALHKEYSFSSMQLVELPPQLAQLPGGTVWRAHFCLPDGKEADFDILPVGRRSYGVYHLNNDPGSSWHWAKLSRNMQVMPTLRAIN